MYPTSSRDFEDNKVLPKKSKVVMLAKTDLFAEWKRRRGISVAVVP